MYRYFLIPALLLSACLQVAAAADKQYDIELVVFQNLVRNDHGEVWPVADPLLAFEGDVDKSPPELGDQPGVIWLSGEQLHLATYRQALKSSSGFRPLAYYAWRQPVLDRNFALVVALPASGTETTAPYIDGTVRVSLGRYLHLDLDLQLHTESRQEEFMPESGGSLQLRLTEQRRMRSKELHYFDHPRMGVIALITPVAEDAPDATGPTQ